MNEIRWFDYTYVSGVKLEGFETTSYGTSVKVGRTEEGKHHVLITEELDPDQEVEWYALHDYPKEYRETVQLLLKKLVESKKEKELTKPPLGLRPRHIAESERLREINEAIIRYVNAGLAIPQEWVDEHREIIFSLNERTVKPAN